MEEATEKNYYEILGLDRYDLMLLDEADVSFTVRARLRELIIDLPNGDTVEEMQANRALEKEYERIADILCDPTARTRYDCEIVTEMARNKTLPVIEPKEKSKVIPGLADDDLEDVEGKVDRILVQREANGVGAAQIIQGEVVDKVRQAQQELLGAGVKVHRAISDLFGL